MPVSSLLGLGLAGRVGQWRPWEKAGEPEAGEKPAISSSFSASCGAFPSATEPPPPVIPTPGGLVPAGWIWIFGSGHVLSCALRPRVGVGGDYGFLLSLISAMPPCPGVEAPAIPSLG